MNMIAPAAAGAGADGFEPAAFLPRDPRAQLVFAGDAAVLKPRPGRLFVGPGMAREATEGLDSGLLLDCAHLLWCCRHELERLEGAAGPDLGATREALRGVQGAVTDALGDLAGTMAMLSEAQAIEAGEYEKAVRVASKPEDHA